MNRGMPAIKKQTITLRHKAYTDLAVGRCNAIRSTMDKVIPTDICGFIRCSQQAAMGILKFLNAFTSIHLPEFGDVSWQTMTM